MLDIKELFLNEEFRCGGFYELCIQVSPTTDTATLKAYNEYFWALNEVAGPYNRQMQKTGIDLDNYRQEGVLILGDKSIPFQQFNIREVAAAGDNYHWFDISFYTATIEQVFGLKPQHWTEIYPFQLAFIDFELSGEYYLHHLKTNLNNWTNTHFYVGSEQYNDIKEEYKQWVTIIDQYQSLPN
jgi:hypothetical protein